MEKICNPNRTSGFLNFFVPSCLCESNDLFVSGDFEISLQVKLGVGTEPFFENSGSFAALFHIKNGLVDKVD